MADETPAIDITIDRVSRRFGERVVLRDVSAQIGAGRVCALTGANGSGKSTLMRIIAGLLRPSQGETRVTVARQSLGPMERRSYLGYAAPDLALYRELTGAENLEFFGRLRGLSVTRDEMIQALTRVGLRGRGKDLVSAYSSGMRQRLKLAFALLGDPPILLLDEPTSNLDADGVAMVASVVSTHRSRPGGGVTVIATNEPREVEWADMQVSLNAAS